MVICRGVITGMDENEIIATQSDDAIQEPTPISTKYAFGRVVTGDGLVRVKIPNNLSDGTGTPGPQGPPGEDGTDGITPHIGTNGNWYIGDEDTGISATGPAGKDGAPGAPGVTPHIGTNGNWYIGTQDTGVSAKGETGADGAPGAPGVTPHIGSNGNWYIGETDTGIPATGPEGPQGPKGDTGDTGPVGPPGADGKDGPGHYFAVVNAAPSGDTFDLTVSDDFQLVDGVTISLLFAVAIKTTDLLSSYTAKFNVNNTGEISAWNDYPFFTAPIGSFIDFEYTATSNKWIAKSRGVASTDSYGVTRLTDTIQNTSMLAATPKAVKQAYDHAQNALDLATEALEAAQNAGGGGEQESKPAIFYGRCKSAASAAEKVVTVDASFELVKGATVFVQFNTYNTATAPKLNVNNTGAIGIVKYRITAPDTYFWTEESITAFVYDGDYWKIVDGTTATTTYYGRTKLSSEINSTSTVLAATPSAVKQAYDKAAAAQTAAETAQATADEALPLAGGTMTGDIRLTQSNGAYGAKLRWGDGDFVYISEPQDDYMEIHASHSIRFTGLDTASSNPLPISQGGTGSNNAIGGLANLGAAAKWDVLWENGSPSSTFAAQTLEIDGQGCNYVTILYEYSTSYPNSQANKSLYLPSVGVQYETVMSYQAQNYLPHRNIYITRTSNGKITFDIKDGYTLTIGSSRTVNNAYIIPVYILGTKI